ncbi:hypothetical protein D047_0356 [Vibrio parahaemolyticus VPTS-2010_2]|nr:hypothetical protein D047_0356 [Vibrio parahaemolyticus VPTS-2010_2]
MREISNVVEVSERHVFTECGKGTSGNVSGKLLLVCKYLHLIEKEVENSECVI